MAALGFTHEPRHSTKIDWYTPPHIFDALGLVFDLDSCSAGAGVDYVPAASRFTMSDDGLAQTWYGTVWCNPPYGSQTGAWLSRMKQHGNGIALVFARTGTRWWHDVAPSADLICFISGRVRFINGQTGEVGAAAGADSVLMAWGLRSATAVLNSGLGMFVSVVKQIR
jgi:phage N-6-adenine-methyltransferase